MIEILAQIEIDRRKQVVTAGIVLQNDRVVETAPILRYMKGWSRAHVRQYCRDKNWKISVVHKVERA
jgi:hypothetical protein